MTAIASTPSRTVGPLLRDWRQRRRLSQLELSTTAEVSSRHLSFVETGRSKPSKELVLHLAEHLEVPLRDRNALLLAAGYAPAYAESSLDAAEMAPVRAALDRIVGGHEPFPAIVVDRLWNLVTANRPALALLSGGVDPSLLGPPTNVLRVSLHPDGLGPRIGNYGEWADHLIERLERQLAVGPDAELSALTTELQTYPGIIDRPRAPVTSSIADRLFVPLVLDHDGTALRFFSTVATFGTPLDVTLSELVIESFFPADDVTTDVLRSLSL